MQGRSLLRLSPEKEMEGRKECFAQLQPGCLFDLGGRRYFIAVKKIYNQEWEVIELTEENRQKIINGGLVCLVTHLHFNEMNCLHLDRQ